MTRTAPAEFRALLAEVPTLAPGTELILRPDARGAMATLRPEGAPPRVFLHTANGIVEQLPHDDSRLPGAPLLADQALLQARLAPLVGAVADAHLVAWRPGRRAVVRVTTGAGAVHWLKLLDRKGHRRASATFAAIGDTLSPLRLALPAHVLEDDCAHLTADAAGRSLRSLLGSGAAIPMTLLTQGLLALGYTDLRAGLPLLDFAHAQRATAGMLEKAACMRHELGVLAEQIRHLPTPALTQTAFVHGDLHDKQLFLGHGTATLIDIEGVGVGDPRFDHVNLAEHVRLRDLQQHGRDGGFADEFLARCGMTSDEPAALLFRAVVRARLCGVYALRPRWRPLVDVLLQETRELMERLR